jgi:hypothetical protein
VSFTKIGHLFSNTTTNNTVATIVAPASNVAGIQITSMVLFCASTAGSGALIYADTSAPSGPSDATKRQIFSAPTGAIATFPFPILIPAGNGLYLTSTNQGSLAVTYDLLS